jgi:hypothetical protein
MEHKLIPLGKLELAPGLDDLFWKEKIQRIINETTSVNTLRQYSTLLLGLCTQRQGVIKGLVKELLTTKNLKIDDSELANPEINVEG